MITKLNVSSVLPLKYVGEKDVIRASPPLAPMGTPTVHTVCFGRPPQPPATRQQPTLARSLQKLSRCWYLALTASSLQTRKIPGIYLSVVGCNCIMWNTAAQVWSKLPNLVGLDVSRMEITPNAVTQLLGAPSLQVVCALNCSVLEEGSYTKPSSLKNKAVLLARFTDLIEGLESLRCGGRNSKGSDSGSNFVCSTSEFTVSAAGKSIMDAVYLFTIHTPQGS